MRQLLTCLMCLCFAFGFSQEKQSKSYFDINYFTNNLIKNNWKSIVADKDPTLDPNGPSRGYRLQLMLLEAAVHGT